MDVVFIFTKEREAGVFEENYYETKRNRLIVDRLYLPMCLLLRFQIIRWRSKFCLSSFFAMETNSLSQITNLRIKNFEKAT